MGKQRFSSSKYNVTLFSREKVTIDVTNSISAGLAANRGLIDTIIPWMQKCGYTRVLDYGAGALRHTIPFLEAGLQVFSVEFESAYSRPKAKIARDKANHFGNFFRILNPSDFLNSKIVYDVAILTYVLQVMPIKLERDLVLEEIATRFDPEGPRQLFYASRYGEALSLPESTRYNDGWVRGRTEKGYSFYTEWKSSETDDIFLKFGYERIGKYPRASQSFVYKHRS